MPKSTINEHIRNIFEEGELEEDAVMRKFGNSEFSTKPTNFYNLDMIISVGYRISQKEAEQHALDEFEKFKRAEIERWTHAEDDLDRAMKQLTKKS